MILLALFVMTCSGLQQEQQQPCHAALQLALPEARLLHDNSTLLANGLIYTTGTFWRDGTTGTYFGCPCNITRCIRMCTTSAGSPTELDALHQLQVWHEESWLNVTVAEHFTVVTGSTCPHRQGLLEPHTDLDDEYAILSNGSLYYTAKKVIEHAEHFCLRVPVEVVICMPPLQPVKRYPPLQKYLYPVLLIISVIFLMLTLAVYLLAPEARNMHGRCLSVHCGCLLIGFLGLFVNRLAGEKAKLPLCYTIALVTYYFLMASFFWLNVMSFDIWQTFRYKSFWLPESATWQEIHAVLFVCKRHADGPVYHHAECTPRCSEQRVGLDGYQNVLVPDYKVYIKLSLIMGVSWISEILSWVLEGRSSYWYFTDIINLLQGFWIFLLCVWTTKNREIFLQRILPSRLSQIFSVHTEVTTV
ncbi:hypothetical protein B566_EDAN006805 [Ephemera danica]|nr:hypothetical protein B566_EDAN006805 [Ephemera danica]